MNPVYIYLLKVNLAIVVFYGFYRLFFHRDTFFKWRRIALLSFLIISFAYPFFDIQSWVKQQEPMVALVDMYAAILPEQEVLPAATGQTINWQTFLYSAFCYTYMALVILLTIRLLVQLAGLIKLRIQARSTFIGRTKVLILDKNVSPFSFFKWIFMNPQKHTAEELNEILIHEGAHVNGWHSVDVILGELLSICCWFNPFIWLLKREIRSNLEYLADHKVIETGHDCRTYQYHLLALAHTKQVATLYNNFNVLPLKKRIKMMNKKRTKQIGRVKYLIFPLLAVALLLVSNIEVVARTTEKVIDEIIGNTVEAVMVTMPQQNDPVFEVVDNMPYFPGGQAALMKYLNTNMVYPSKAMQNNIQGRVIVQYVVNKDGSLSDIKIIRSLDPDLDAEAMRVIKGMPKWEPGKHKGEIVRVKYTIPIIFRLGTKEMSPPPTETVTSNEDGIYQIADKMPQFPGGQNALMKFISDNIEYPVSAQEKGLQGRVIIQFVVSSTGEILNPVVIRSIDPDMDAAAIRLILSSPKWEPAEVKGKGAVNCKYTLPIIFRLS